MKYFSFLFVLVSSLANAQFITNNGIQIRNSASLITNGDWQNSGVLRHDGIIVSTESWQHAGTMDVNSVGGFVLQYSTDKLFSAGSNSARIGFIQKEGIGNALISGRVAVKDSLKIISGLIMLSTTADTLGITSTALVTRSTNSYVDGPMARFGSGTFTFPLGKSGTYLPIKFYSSNSSRVGVIVEDAPVGYTAADAVESVPGFPYAWRTVTAQPADNASYIEILVPDGLVSGIIDPIVAQKINTSEFEGMGAKILSSDGTNTTIRSYSSGLKGLFSVVNGYPGTTVGDSTELQNLFTATIGSSWTTRTNWTVSNQKFGSWYGVVEKGGRVTAINMPGNNIQGGVPTSIINMAALKTLDISNNKVTSIPDLTVIPAMTTPTATLDVSSNNLDFASLEVNATLIPQIGNVDYATQALVTDSTYIEAPVNTLQLLNVTVGGSTNQYQWKFQPYYGGTNFTNVDGAISSSYSIPTLNRSTIGKYSVEITNPQVPGLVLSSDVFQVEAVAAISGMLKYKTLTADDPVTAGKMTLLEITSGGYDTIQQVSVLGSPPTDIGKYTFSSVKLRDYVVNGFADTLLTAYKNALPTWYWLPSSSNEKGTLYWEEAEPLVVTDNVTGLDIISEVKPAPLIAGIGSITGTFYETIDDGGRIMAKSRVSGSGVSVRKVQQSGRGQAEILTLISYLFTDENGQFEFTLLDENEYRINLQYPGYPMDETSYITIPVVDNLFERQVAVDAEVIAGKVFVRKLIITGWEEENHSMMAYPNPTVEYLFITGLADQSMKFRMYDSNGANIAVRSKWNEINKQLEVDVRELKPGAYFFKTERGGKIETLRILVR